ncbi:MAG: C25 family cysteine peptidase [Syntrophobacteraceae bacterium]
MVKRQNLDLEPAVKALKNWKEAKGITTDTILIDDLPAPSSCLASCKLQSPPANPSNCPLACKLKQYIRGRSGLNSLLKYVLLFGDADTIPTETAAEQVPSDYYYSTSSDQLSNQSDDLSRVFLPPQLSIGRIPVQTVDEAWIVVDKIKSYEQSPPPEGTGYYEKLTLTAYAGNPTPDLQAAEPDPYESVLIIQDRFQSCYTGINVEGIYQNSNLGTNVDNPPFYGEKAAVKALSSATEDGRMIIGYEGHGMPQYWQAPKLLASDLPTLHYQPSVLYSACCHVGQFNCGVDSFAESTLKTKGPVVAGIAATSNSYPITNHPLMQALFDATFGDILDTFPAICNLSYPIKNGRLGDILNYAKFFVQSRYPNELSYAVCELYHVIGDPTLEVWTVPPLTFNVNVTIVNNWLEFELSPCPDRCVLTLWEGDTILGKIITSAAPSVNFTIPCRHLIGQLKIGCWAPGYKYAEMPLSSPTLAPPSGLHIT